MGVKLNKQNVGGSRVSKRIEQKLFVKGVKDSVQPAREKNDRSGEPPSFLSDTWIAKAMTEAEPAKEHCDRAALDPKDDEELPVVVTPYSLQELLNDEETLTFTERI